MRFLRKSNFLCYSIAIKIGGEVKIHWVHFPQRVTKYLYSKMLGVLLVSSDQERSPRYIPNILLLLSLLLLSHFEGSSF